MNKLNNVFKLPYRKLNLFLSQRRKQQYLFRQTQKKTMYSTLFYWQGAEQMQKYAYGDNMVSKRGVYSKNAF